MAVPVEDRTIAKCNFTMVTAPASVEEIPSDSEDEDTISRSNSPVIPARSLGAFLSSCCLRGIKVCILIILLLLAAVISQPASVGRESSKRSWAKRYAAKIKPTIPLVIPLLGEKRKVIAPATDQTDLKRKKVDVGGKDCSSAGDNSMNVVWPEMKHLLDDRVAEGFKDWDMYDVFNEAGSNAYKVCISYLGLYLQ